MERALQRMKRSDTQLELKIFSFLFPLTTLLFGIGAGLILSNSDQIAQDVNPFVFVAPVIAVVISFVYAYRYYFKLLHKWQSKT